MCPWGWLVVGYATGQATALLVMFAGFQLRERRRGRHP